MKVLEFRNLKISVSPEVKRNIHVVTIDDQDMGRVYKTVSVTTDKADVYFMIEVEISVNGSLSIGDGLEISEIEFCVLGVLGKWYRIATTETKQPCLDLELSNLITKSKSPCAKVAITPNPPSIGTK